jgi:mannose-6-phosphate isomerase-like protein (cupin superfamily)
MSIDPGPYDLARTRLIMAPNGDATTKNDSPTFYEELGRNFPDFAGHALVQQFAFDEPWPTWEVHPHGDEFVYLLSGAVDFLLKIDDEIRTLRVDQPGSYVVVPGGVWHTAKPVTPCALLFVTPGEGTLNQETPD